MTQQYIVGELSALLAELAPVRVDSLWVTVGALRYEVECSPRRLLPGLAREALDLGDLLCRSALERGDVAGFCRYAGAAAALHEFAVDANLLP